MKRQRLGFIILFFVIVLLSGGVSFSQASGDGSIVASKFSMIGNSNGPTTSAPAPIVASTFGMVGS